MSISAPANSRTGGWLLVYGLMIAGAVLAFWGIQSAGQGLSAATVDAPAVPAVVQPVGTTDVVLHVLATLAAIVALGSFLGWCFQRIGQTAVIGEVVAGILLGPSLLGRISPEAMHWLIPDAATDPHGLVLSSLKTIAQLGVCLYMFQVGQELNLQKIGRQAHTAIAISHAGIIVPFLLSMALALWLHPILAPEGVSFTSFALFLGVAMAITAFPVLARILTDRGLDKTEIGAIALSCAAVDDVTAWCLLAFVVGVAQAQISSAVMVTVLAVEFIAGMFVVVRPLAVRCLAWVEDRGWDRQAMPWLLVALLVAGLCTEAIGIHAVFGTFLLGAVLPHDSRVAQDLTAKLRDVVAVLLLPAFFAVTGMNTQINLIAGGREWLICGVIILVATVGKFGGSTAAARLTGSDWRTATALGVLMNTRGLMELIVLNIGLSLGIISPTLFAMMVVMALVTTLATAPLLQRLLGDSQSRGWQPRFSERRG